MAAALCEVPAPPTGFHLIQADHAEFARLAQKPLSRSGQKRTDNYLSKEYLPVAAASCDLILSACIALDE